MGYYRDEADSISLDIQQFVKEEVEYLFRRAVLVSAVFLSFVVVVKASLRLISVAMTLRYLSHCR